MTAGNQGKAYDDAQAALKLDPKNKDLQRDVATTKAAVNTSLESKGQKPIR